MADLAFVFHWPPSVMDCMDLADLMAWREQARLRHEPQE
jgi:hypothetical protein